MMDLRILFDTLIAICAIVQSAVCMSCNFGKEVGLSCQNTEKLVFVDLNVLGFCLFM